MSDKHNTETHDRVLDALVERLLGKYGFEADIRTKLEYEVGKIVGELDVLRRNGDPHVMFMYECKSHDTEKGWNKACRQYKRFCRAYYQYDIKGVYVTPTCVRRLR